MAKKEKQEDVPAGAPLWMATFGDLMSLLLTFFVLLLSFATMEEAAFNAAMGSIQGALGVLRDPFSKVNVLEREYTQPVSYHYRFVKQGTITDFRRTQDIELAYKSEKIKDSLTEMAEDLENYTESQGMADMVSVDFYEKGLKIKIPTTLLFEQGNDKLKKDQKTKEFLEKIFALLSALPYGISVEGHTDDTHVSNTKFSSNWDLSSDRSLKVLKYFVNRGVSPQRIESVSCGEFRPIADNGTLKGRKHNRRVEIKLDVSKRY